MLCTVVVEALMRIRPGSWQLYNAAAVHSPGGMAARLSEKVRRVFHDRCNLLDYYVWHSPLLCRCATNVGYTVVATFCVQSEGAADTAEALEVWIMWMVYTRNNVKLCNCAWFLIIIFAMQTKPWNPGRSSRSDRCDMPAWPDQECSSFACMCTYMLVLFFLFLFFFVVQILKEWNPFWSPKFWITDYSEAEMLAVQDVFPTCKIYNFCATFIVSSAGGDGLKTVGMA